MGMFEIRPVKRAVQKLIFDFVNPNEPISIVGLAGDSPEQYEEIVQNHLNVKGITLVDKNRRANSSIILGDICTISKELEANMFDCDFCGTIKTAGVTLKGVYESMKSKDISGSKILSYTFSMRKGGGREKFFEFLNDTLYQGTLKDYGNGSDLLRSLSLNGMTRHSYMHRVYHEQYVFKKSIMISYLDKTPMISGAVVWK